MKRFYLILIIAVCFFTLVSCSNSENSGNILLRGKAEYIWLDEDFSASFENAEFEYISPYLIKITGQNGSISYYDPTNIRCMSGVVFYE